MLVPLLTGKLRDSWGAHNLAQLAAARQQAQVAQQRIDYYRERMEVLFNVAHKLGETLTGEKVLNVLMDKANTLVPFDAGAALLPTGKEGELQAEAGYNLSMVDHGFKLIVAYGSVLAEAFSTPPRPIRITDISQETVFADLTTTRSHKAACLIPLYSGYEIFGAVLVMRKSATPFEDTEIAILESLIIYATCALLNAELAAEIRKDRLDKSCCKSKPAIIWPAKFTTDWRRSSPLLR
ncbi:MAG: GAF domain-containing protein [Chloroflexaceae bacterium]|nr:GAF domain-containing protein [Chloroflexaceae bacterium]